jgi:hypothetical protein
MLSIDLRRGRDLFAVGRHLLSASNYRMALSRRFIEWRSITSVFAAA